MNVKHKESKSIIHIGCGSLFLLSLLFVVIWAMTGLYHLYYESDVKESLIVQSYSPHHIHHVKVIHIGSGSMKVKIQYQNKDITKFIGNDGQSVGRSNVKVRWNHDNEAIVTLTGKEQKPEKVLLHFEE